MSDKSKNSDELIRPFEKNVEETAKKLADKYQIVLTQEDGMWFGHGLEMPNVFGEGKTSNQCVKNTLEALRASIAVMLEAGQMPPMPANHGQRSEQVNIRLSAVEKAVIEAFARSKGYRGIADYMRAGALAFS